ncbi:MAG: hypothetical protein ACPKOP_04115 [Sphaerochaetaceae bacterium]
MGIETLIKLAGGLGPTVALFAFVLAVGIGIGIMVFTMKTLAKSIDSQSDAFKTQMAEDRERSDERDKRIEELLAGQNLRIAYIETRYATKEDLYTVAGGWREEYNHLNKRIDQIRDSHNKE